MYAIYTRERYILLSRLGLGINFIQWIPVRSYNDKQFVPMEQFVVTPSCQDVDTLCRKTTIAPSVHPLSFLCGNRGK